MQNERVEKTKKGATHIIVPYRAWVRCASPHISPNSSFRRPRIARMETKKSVLCKPKPPILRRFFKMTRARRRGERKRVRQISIKNSVVPCFQLIRERFSPYLSLHASRIARMKIEKVDLCKPKPPNFRRFFDMTRAKRRGGRTICG